MILPILLAGTFICLNMGWYPVLCYVSMGGATATTSRTLAAAPLMHAHAAWIERFEWQGREEQTGKSSLRDHHSYLVLVRWPEP